VKPPAKSNLKCGEYVLVEFSAEDSSTRKPFIGRLVESSGNSDYEAVFFHPKSGDESLFVFPEKQDRCTFSKKQIIGVLEKPEILRRGVYKFKVDNSKW
jgi:hypothetical protein